MPKISIDVETWYDRGDVVVFNYHDKLMVGVITSYYVDHDAGRSIWYNISISKDTTLNYTNGGDIAEFDILGKLDDPLILAKVRAYLQGAEWDSIRPVENEIEIQICTDGFSN